MGAWGQNIALEMLHVLVGICFEGLGYLSIEMHVGLLVGGKFQGSSFEVHVSWRAISNRLKQTLGCHGNMACFYVGLFQNLCCLCVETCAKPP